MIFLRKTIIALLFITFFSVILLPVGAANCMTVFFDDFNDNYLDPEDWTCSAVTQTGTPVDPFLWITNINGRLEFDVPTWGDNTECTTVLNYTGEAEFEVDFQNGYEYNYLYKHFELRGEYQGVQYIAGINFRDSGWIQFYVINGQNTESIELYPCCAVRNWNWLFHLKIIRNSDGTFTGIVTDEMGHHFEATSTTAIPLDVPLNMRLDVSLWENGDPTLIWYDNAKISFLNSPPYAAPTGGGTYQIFSDVVLGGQVSDVDGDELTYVWSENGIELFSGSVTTPLYGDPIDLPEHIISNLSLGLHTLTLSVDDGVNDPVTSDITVEIIDTIAPTLAPVPNKTILWPPNHEMVDIVIEANASDNSGGPVALSVEVSSNEPEDGLCNGDEAPDWTEPVIDQANGIITLQLRSERSGAGEGRIYSILITATDDSDNSSSSTVEIIVPHDKRKKGKTKHRGKFRHRGHL
jgi:hypothetical protein